MPETSAVRYERTSPQVAKITFANPPVNLIVGETVARLTQIVKELAADPDWFGRSWSWNCPKRLTSPSRRSGRTRGGGNELSLALDLRYASREKAIFGQPEVGSGLSTDLGSTSASPTSGTQSWKNAHRRN